MIAYTFLELNKLQLPDGGEVRLQPDSANIPFGVVSLITTHLAKKFDVLKVYCKKTDSYEIVSF